ncbi:MAG: lipoyl(octanoyl) transferase [Bacteroidetes bacterium GWE2_29_8]|nr:MAG: lipoyl(octanoyl) transferase [Bacteroidetes bacterium GWE2_29_8]OFY16600.1 MAG: lipoyl(octanoyl) transferase [Bacteroidetes bacterium GWF2_29_10]HBY20717.1 lipoate--protein ligase [Clostridiales bacterium]
MEAIHVVIDDIGLISYSDAYQYQENIFNNAIKKKINKLTDNNENVFILCEHTHVYTLGKSGSEQNMLLNYIQLQAKNAEFVKTTRGGDITYHGPGQIVGYPIIDLEVFGFSVKGYVHNIEEVIIKTLKDFNIESTRLEGATGVWLDIDKPGKTRKICAIGIRVSRGITMHGFAFNVNTDLNYFNHINPCGFTDKGVTSISKELGEVIDINLVKKHLIRHFGEIFKCAILPK